MLVNASGGIGEDECLYAERMCHTDWVEDCVGYWKQVAEEKDKEIADLRAKIESLEEAISHRNERIQTLEEMTYARK